MYQELPQQEHHELLLEKIDETGTEEWHCPTCGRRFLMLYNPEYKMVTLENGDIYAIHSGGSGGLNINSSQAIPIEQGSSDDPRLQTWTDLLDQVDFDGLWKRDLD